MKYAILLFVSAGLLFAACKKKSNAVGCYVCTHVNQKSSNIPGYIVSKPVTSTGTTCNLNSGQAAFYVKQHNATDTITVSLTGDTIIYNIEQTTCINQ